MSVPTVDALAIAVFDHGAAPPGVSDRRFRFDFIEETIRRAPVPSAFAYLAAQTPPSLTRLRAVATSAQRYVKLSGSAQDIPLLLMDTGSAAALGALEDPLVRSQRESLLCNIGNFHTLAFHLREGRIVGTFEHHTGEITRPQLEAMLIKLAYGTLTNDEVFNTSGHGALILQPPTEPDAPLPFSGCHRSSARTLARLDAQSVRGHATRRYDAHGKLWPVTRPGRTRCRIFTSNQTGVVALRNRQAPLAMPELARLFSTCSFCLWVTLKSCEGQPCHCSSYARSRLASTSALLISRMQSRVPKGS